MLKGFENSPCLNNIDLYGFFYASYKMKDLIINDQTMALKEITDLLDVRHNDAMVVVEKLSSTAQFGRTTKFSYPTPSALQPNAEITTYLLTKRQSIAVSARLNTELLLRIIDRWQQLEAQFTLQLQQEITQLKLTKPERKMTTKLKNREVGDMLTATQLLKECRSSITPQEFFAATDAMGVLHQNYRSISMSKKKVKSVRLNQYLRETILNSVLSLSRLEEKINEVTK